VGQLGDAQLGFMTTAGVYAAAVTAILIGAGMLFLFTFVYWHEATIDREQPKS
jgi:hypothetical protein